MVQEFGVWPRRGIFGKGGGGASALPLPTLTSPVFAYDAKWALANSKLWQDEDKTTLATSDGDVIGAVEQVDGFGAVDATQEPTSARPLLKLDANGINGKPTMLFGGDDWLNLTGITASSGAFTFFVVYEPASASGSFKYLLDTQTGRLILRHLGSVSGKTGYFDGSSHPISDASANSQILVFAFDAGAGTIYRNGDSLGSDTYTNKALGGLIAIGADNSGASSHYAGKISAIYCQNAVVPAERALMEAYLSQQYGITLS